MASTRKRRRSGRYGVKKRFEEMREIVLNQPHRKGQHYPIDPKHGTALGRACIAFSIPDVLYQHAEWLQHVLCAHFRINNPYKWLISIDYDEIRAFCSAEWDEEQIIRIKRQVATIQSQLRQVPHHLKLWDLLQAVLVHDQDCSHWHRSSFEQALTLTQRKTP